MLRGNPRLLQLRCFAASWQRVPGSGGQTPVLAWRRLLWSFQSIEIVHAAPVAVP